MEPLHPIRKASRALARIYRRAYCPSKSTKSTKISLPNIPYKALLKSPGCNFLNYDALFAQTTLDSDVKLIACIDTRAAISVMTRQAYLDHCSNRPLHLSPVKIAVEGVGGSLVPANEWFHADFHFQGSDGSTFTISGEVHIVEDGIGDHGLCILIGPDLMKPARAKIILDIDKKGTDVLSVDNSWAELRSFRSLLSRQEGKRLDESSPKLTNLKLPIDR
jgi:hypothetical protein